jgi:DNA-binding CsgD family transcriptional regulator
VHSSIAPHEQSLLDQITSDAFYFSRVLEVVHEFRACGDISQAIDLLQHITTRMGAEVSIFVSFIPEDRTRGSHRVLLACNPELINEYDALARHDDDPWLSYARSHHAPVRGSELEVANESQRALINLSERFGFRSSVIVPVPSPGGLTRTGVLCFGSSTKGYFEAEGYLAFRLLAQSVAMEFHEWWIARLRDELMVDAGIDEEDRQLLSLEAQGLTSKQIARRLFVSIACVDSRIRRIRARLQAPTRQAAVRVALEYGLIDPSATKRGQP